MDGGHDGGVDEGAVGERQEVEAVVDDVEFVGVFEHVGDVDALGNLGDDVVVFGPPGGDCRAKLRGGYRVSGGEDGDLVTESNETFGECRGEQLPRAVVARRGTPCDR